MGLNRFIYGAFKPIEILMAKRGTGSLLKVGDRAPDFMVQSHEGESVTLKSFAGKHLVLWFFPKADTLGCTLEGCAFRDHHAGFEKKNAVVLGVSFDGVKANRNFAEKFGFPFLLLCDTEREMGIAYGACKDKTAGTPARIGYWIGSDGLVKAVYPHADATEFPQSVLAQI